jgi:hypothetical protein
MSGEFGAQGVVPDFPDPGGYLVGGCAAPCYQGGPPRVADRPLGKIALAQEVLIVQKQFFETCPGHAGQLEFGFSGSAAGFAAFGDILHSAARRLHHLVTGAASERNETVAKPNCHIEAQPRQLKCLEPPVSAMPDNDWFQHFLPQDDLFLSMIFWQWVGPFAEGGIF